jgi:hypothetical protein
MAEPRLTCPSAPCEAGNSLIGIVQPNGTVGLLKQPLVIDQQFVEAAREGRPPEKRFRFSTQCAQSGCEQWTGRNCGLVSRLLDHVTPLDRVPDNCPIHATCRWHAEHGTRACAICPRIVTMAANVQPVLPTEREIVPRTATPA